MNAIFERATDEDVRIVQGGIWADLIWYTQKTVNEVETARPWRSKKKKTWKEKKKPLARYCNRMYTKKKKKISFEEAGGQNFQETCSTTDCIDF